MCFINCCVIIIYLILGIQILTILVPALINFLIDTELTKSDTSISKFRCTLNEYSLQCLLKIGPIYPQVYSLVYVLIWKN